MRTEFYSLSSLWTLPTFNCWEWRLWNMCVQIFLQYPCFQFFGWILKSGIAGPFMSSLFWRITSAVHSGCIHLDTGGIWGFWFLFIFTTLVIILCCFFLFFLFFNLIVAILAVWGEISLCLSFIPPKCVTGHLCASFRECLFKFFVRLRIRLFVFAVLLKEC